MSANPVNVCGHRTSMPEYASRHLPQRAGSPHRKPAAGRPGGRARRPSSGHGRYLTPIHWSRPGVYIVDLLSAASRLSPSVASLRENTVPGTPDPPFCSAAPFVISRDGCVQIRPIWRLFGRRTRPLMYESGALDPSASAIKHDDAACRLRDDHRCFECVGSGQARGCRPSRDQACSGSSRRDLYRRPFRLVRVCQPDRRASAGWQLPPPGAASCAGQGWPTWNQLPWSSPYSAP